MGTLAHYLHHQGLCLHCPLLSSCAAKIRFNQEVHIPVKSHPSCQGEGFILQGNGGVKLKSPHGLRGVHVDIKMIFTPSSKEIINT